MRFPALRRSLDALIRTWYAPYPVDEDRWGPIESEVRARAAHRAKRYQLSLDDREDMTSEVCLRLWQFLHTDAAGRVYNFDAYISHLIENLCKGQIRRDKPVWTRLKGEIMETLRGRRGATEFALWKNGKEDVGGCAVWIGRDVQWTPRYAQCQQDVRSLWHHVSAAGRPEQTKLPELLGALFDWLDTPLPVNELTSLVFELQGLQEVRSEPPQPGSEAAAATTDVETGFWQTALLRQVTEAFHQLPRHECAAFLFHLQPEVAERLLIAANPDGGAKGMMAFLAARLQMSPETLESALDEIPWKDLRIAELLCIRQETDRATQQDIINLRQRALRCMRRYVENAGTNTAARSPFAASFRHDLSQRRGAVRRTR
jgi:hypothetical protein